MLLQATIGVSLFAMSVTLWMGFYLFARGFPRAMTLRVVIVMLALSGFFYGAYLNVFEQIQGSAAVRAVLLVIVLAGWYSVTFHVMSEPSQKKYRYFEWGIYALAVLSILFLIQPNAFLNEQGNALYVAHMNPQGWAFRVYGGYQFIISFGIMLNLLVGDRVGLTTRGKYFLVTSIFPVISVIYGVLALGSPTPVPRLIQDTLAFCGVVVLGLSVARHQTMTERRTTYQDFPLTTLSTLGLTGITLIFAKRAGMPQEDMASVAAFVILAVGMYDLTREFLERQRTHDESQFRKQLRAINNDAASEDALRAHLRDGLELLCNTINAPGGFVAMRRGDEFLVMASMDSVQVGSELPASAVSCDDVSHPKDERLSTIAWLAPSFEGQTQVAVVGIEETRSKLEYPSGSLEFLAEAADLIGTIISSSNTQASGKTDKTKSELLESISVDPDKGFVKMVEDGLRHLHDVITLGESQLADTLAANGETHIDRGKFVQQLLMDSIELLKPDQDRPPEPIPRIWYNHVVLYDAYVEGVQNREIMARLYISEGTFNRTRRNAIRGLARVLIEKTG